MAFVFIGLFLMIHMLLEKPHGKTPRVSVSAPQAPEPQSIAYGVQANIETVIVPHVEAERTTETFLSERGPDCLPCAQQNGCLDPAQQAGGTCDQLSGEARGCGQGVTERDICHKIMNDVFESKCAESLQETPCLCGTTDVMDCLNGTAAPTGPIFRDYACDFNTTDVTVIYRDFLEPSYGAGRANMLIQCVAGYGCGCFGH